MTNKKYVAGSLLLLLWIGFVNCALAENNGVRVGRTTLNNQSDHTWLDYFGIQVNEFPFMVQTPVYGVQLRIDVWEPGDINIPTSSNLYGPEFTSADKGGTSGSWKVSFIPPKLKEVVTDDSYPAVLDWQVSGYVGREKINLPMNYLGLKIYGGMNSPLVFSYNSFSNEVPIFHYIFSSGGYVRKETSMELRNANPTAVHIVGNLVPMFERNTFEDACNAEVPKVSSAKKKKQSEGNGLLPINTPAPIWSAPDLNGTLIESTAFSGRIQVLNFWATWCGPCLAEIPDFIDLQSRYRDRGVDFIGFCIDRELSKEELKLFLKWKFVDTPLNYPCVMPAKKTQQKFGKISSIPVTYIVDKEGKVVWAHVGKVSCDELSAEIDLRL